jgi:hypothetical protein
LGHDRRRGDQAGGSEHGQTIDRHRPQHASRRHDHHCAANDVPSVGRALDMEAEHREIETTEGVGTRHRSAYRLRQAIPEALAIVISQNGDVRFVICQDGAVDYWNQMIVGMAES